MNKGTLTSEKERRIFRGLLREVPAEEMAAVLASDLFQIFGTNRSETILLETIEKLQRGEV